MNECLFCKIVRKESPATIVYENEHVTAFLSIHPVNLGHTLIVPNVHSENLYETPDEDLSNVIIASKKIASAIKSALGADGINIINNNERGAGQVIFHTHFHIIPRFHDDGYAHWRGPDRSDKEIHEVGDKIKAILNKA